MQEPKAELCLYCKIEFMPAKKWQKFCCNKHRNAWHNDQKLAKMQALLAELNTLRGEGSK